MDLFDSARVLQTVPVAEGSIALSNAFYGQAAADRIFSALQTETPWREETVTVWGKRHIQPRLIAWFGDSDARYKYSGLVVDPLPWTELLSSIRREVQEATQARFNSVLLNLYRNERDRMGWHSDNEPELGEQPVIASLSLGEERVFKLKHKQRKHEDVRIRLPHGSLLLMGGDLQRYWKHAVDKETAAKGPRINLTFRLIKPLAKAWSSTFRPPVN